MNILYSSCYKEDSDNNKIFVIVTREFGSWKWGI